MLGHKVRDFKPLIEISLDGLVPKNNFYRGVNYIFLLPSMISAA
jgi:hypothetical protein